MKCVFSFAVLALSFATVAHAADFGCDNELQYRAARKAQKRVSAATLKRTSATSVGVGNCNPFWAARVLGLPHVMVAKPPVCGVVLGFENERDMKWFARDAYAKGLEIEVDSGNARRAVPVCGRVTGPIRPQ
jgi:hypothetical protein